jgi:hypothetical protein
MASIPYLHHLAPDSAESWPADQKTLDIEGVVDGRVSGDETLGRPGRLKALHLAFSSSQGPT